jgi:hypothetical protein
MVVNANYLILSLLKLFSRGIKNGLGEITSVAINLTMIYDCLNKFTVDFEFDGL